MLRERIQELERLHEEVREAWQSLISREEQFRKITESAPDAIISLDDAGRITSWNRAATKMFGYQEEAVVGRELAALVVAAGSRDPYSSALDDLRVAGRNRVADARVELQVVRGDGAVFPAETLLSGVNLNGQWQTTVLFRDVTEQRKSAADIRQLTAIIRDATDAITVQDFSGRILGWNRSAERMYGWSEAEAQGMKSWDLVPEARREETSALFATLMHGGNRALLETQRITQGGDVVDVLVTATALNDESGKPVAVATTERDISERAVAEQELREHFAEIAHIARMTTTGEFVTELANELSQPVAAIMANVRASARMLEAGKLTFDQLSEIIEEISGESSRTGDIIRRLQDFVRNIYRQRQAVNLNHVVRSVYHLVDLEARPRGCEVQLRLAQDIPDVLADEIQIQQLLLNLARNALQAMDGATSERRELQLTTALAPTGEVELSVSDTGEGISAEIAHRVFEPLFSTKPKCIGLGLSISRSIAEAHGGSLEMESEFGRGSVFRLRLPVNGG